MDSRKKQIRLKKSRLTIMWNWLKCNSTQLQAIASIVQIIGIVLIVVTLFLTISQLRLTVKQIKLNAAQVQGTTIQEIAKQGRLLFMKAWDDPELRCIVDTTAQDCETDKGKAFIGILIQHYATAFRQKQLRNIPEAYWQEIQSDAKQFFESPEVKKKWPQVKNFYQQDFIVFVEMLMPKC